MAKRKKKARKKSPGKRSGRKKVPSRKTEVVAHFLDGTLLKGTTDDFFIENETFTLTDRQGTIEIVTVAELKALFFVKSVDGNHDYHEKKGFYTKKTNGSKVMVEFFDGELLFGHTHVSYSDEGAGFFMLPGDPNSNNIKVFIVRSSTKRIKVIPEHPLVHTHA